MRALLLLLLTSPARAQLDLDAKTAARRFTAPAAAAAGFSLDLKPLTAYVRANARTLDWAAVVSGPERIVYLGETHGTVPLLEELGRRMADFKAAGITHLAVEMVARDRQASLDAFAAGKPDGEAALARALREEWGWTPEAYLELLRAARDAGLKLAALDLPYEVRHAISARCDRGADPKGYCRLKDEFCEGRDCEMSGRLARLLDADPKARVLVLAGEMHVLASSQPEHLRRLNGVASRSFAILVPSQVENVYEQAVDAAGLRGARLMLPLPRETASRDGMIILPEVLSRRRGLDPEDSDAPVPPPQLFHEP